MTNNAGPTATYREDRERMFEMYDRLPFELRRLISIAPINYALGPYMDRYLRERAVFDPAELAIYWAKTMATTRRRQCLALYGPQHPQAS
jgi:hypothetical protein